VRADAAHDLDDFTNCHCGAAVVHTADYLTSLGVPQLPPRLSPFDPGYDAGTVEGHIEQSAHLISSLKISMATWIVCAEEATRRKVAAARRHDIPVVTGGGPFEVAYEQGVLEEYLDLCADIGASRIECAEGFTQLGLDPPAIVELARARGLEVQFELGEKHGGTFSEGVVGALIDEGRRWLDAGAVGLVVEARESGDDIGVFAAGGAFQARLADRLAEAFGLDALIFEAPNKPTQFALLDHFGPEVNLGNVRLEEILRVEIYRRGLHSDAFRNPKLRPPARKPAS
jgi:phosphosulfolactate synthase